MLLGIHRRGVPMAQRMAAPIGRKHQTRASTWYSRHQSVPRRPHEVAFQPVVHEPKSRPTSTTRTSFSSTMSSTPAEPFEPRSMRLCDFGRMRSIQLAVMIDRGHRELPIEANFIGKKIATKDNEVVEVRLNEIDGEDAIYVMEKTGLSRMLTKRSARNQELRREEFWKFSTPPILFRKFRPAPSRKSPHCAARPSSIFSSRRPPAREHLSKSPGKRLSADVVNISLSTSSVSKGETLIDTARTLDAMAADCVVVRHASSGAPHTWPD